MKLRGLVAQDQVVDPQRASGHHNRVAQYGHVKEESCPFLVTEFVRRWDDQLGDEYAAAHDWIRLVWVEDRIGAVHGRKQQRRVLMLDLVEKLSDGLARVHSQGYTLEHVYEKSRHSKVAAF